MLCAAACFAPRSIEPELYPRPDGTVYVCGEPSMLPVPADGPAAVSLEQDALQVLQVRGSQPSTTGMPSYERCQQHASRAVLLIVWWWWWWGGGAVSWV